MAEGYDDEQLKFRAQHGGLTWETVRNHKGDAVETRKRDGWMERLFSSLGGAQQDAMIEIEIAYRTIVAGIGFKSFDPHRTGGRSNGGESDRQAQRVADYFAWAREVQRRRIADGQGHAITMAIIAEGMTCRQVAKNFRVHLSRPMRALHATLDVYCELRGWPTGSKNPKPKKKI